jgi:phage terminase small subunit
MTTQRQEGARSDPQSGTSDTARSAYDALSPQHKAFVEAYCKCWNARRAARAAGYSECTANSHAYAVLRRDDVQAAIEEWKREPARKAYALLKPGHKAFLDAYCQSWNAGKAGVAAGYGEHFGYRLLRRDDIRAALIERQALAAASKEVEISEVVATLTRVLRANMLDYMSIDAEGQLQVDFTSLTRDQASAISELNVETRKTIGDGNRRLAAEVARLRLKLHDKLRAADKLLRHLGAVKPKGAPAEEVAAPPAKPVTDLDRAKAVLALFAKVKEEGEQSSGDS